MCHQLNGLPPKHHYFSFYVFAASTVYSKAYSELCADLRCFIVPQFLRQHALEVISDVDVSLLPADLKASWPEIKKAFLLYQDSYLQFLEK